MYVKSAIACVLLASAPAFAQHDHAVHEHPQESSGVRSHFMAGAALVAASFDTMLYLGNYQGVLPSAGWMSDRYSLSASGAAYRVYENGAEYYGLGDASLHAAATLLSTSTIDAGAMLMVSFPTGDHVHGLGMGHLMVMPSLTAAWRAARRVRVAATAGYSRGIGGDAHHDHGTWPLVAPMLLAEVSWSAAADVRVVPTLSAGLRASGGLPAGEGGDARAAVGAQVAWHAGPTETSFELQAGVAGDPFTVRGVVATTLSF